MVNIRVEFILRKKIWDRVNFYIESLIDVVNVFICDVKN